MLTSFLCRRCNARLATPLFPSLRHSSTLAQHRHTRSLPADPQHSSESLSEPFPAPFVEPFSEPLPPTAPLEPDATTLHLPFAGHDLIVKRYHFRKPCPANSIRDLKAKILKAHGNFNYLRHEIASLLAISTAEARHAVTQLERLLWPLSDMQHAADQLDHYIVWKTRISPLFNPRTAAPAPPRVESRVQSHIQSTDGNEADVAAQVSVKTEQDLVAVRTVLEREPETNRKLLWSHITLNALGDGHPFAPLLIGTTFDPSWSPSYMAEDAAYVLYRRQQTQQSASQDAGIDRDTKAATRLAALCAAMIKKSPPRYLNLEQPILAFLCAAHSPQQLVAIYRHLKAGEHPLTVNTLLHFASRFAKCYATKTNAADVLHGAMAIPGFDINAPSTLSVCTSLLALKPDEPLPDDNAAPDLLFQFLIESGLRPNLLNLTALMQNFCLHGRVDTAWKVIELMYQYRIRLDPHVYSIFLNGAKRQLDVHAVKRIIDIIDADGAWHVGLVNDLLELIYLDNEAQIEHRRRQRKKRNPSWRPMFDLYFKFFELAPLQKLVNFPLENLLTTWVVRPEYETHVTQVTMRIPRRREDQLMQPDTNTLCLMLASHMRSVYRSHQHVTQTYERFWRLVESKDPTAIAMLKEQGSRVFDIFLRSLMQFRETQSFILTEMQRMMDRATEEERTHGRNIFHHPPSIHTWTILLNGFKNHRDVRSALLAIEMLKRLPAIRANIVTWTILIQIFAQARHTAGALMALQALEHTGLFSIHDEHIVKALRQFPRAQRNRIVAQLHAANKPAKTSLAQVASVFNGPVPIAKPRPDVAASVGELAGELKDWEAARQTARARKNRHQRIRKRASKRALQNVENTISSGPGSTTHIGHPSRGPAVFSPRGYVPVIVDSVHVPVVTQRAATPTKSWKPTKNGKPLKHQKPIPKDGGSGGRRPSRVLAIAGTSERPPPLPKGNSN
ncbi:hypothetical protein GGR57DRAFT_486834 [Xylariaceae sp. FL1272]|nr:hypothetical protein GGR57DRAFT_486834 [Xylariaceae sp. FL1272]